MILDLSQNKQVDKFKEYSLHLLHGLKKVDIKEQKNTRTTRQNAALHLYFTMISQELNELGMEFQYFGSFKMEQYDRYKGRNSNTGEITIVKPKKMLFFKCGKELKERVDI